MPRRELALGALIAVHPRRRARSATRASWPCHRPSASACRPAARAPAACAHPPTIVPPRPSGSKRNMCAVCASSSRPTSSPTHREQPRRLALRRHRRRHAPQRGLLVGEPVQRLLGHVARGQVAQVAVEHQRAPGDSGRVTTSSTGNRVPSRAHRGQLHPPPHDRPAPGPQVAREPALCASRSAAGMISAATVPARPSPSAVYPNAAPPRGWPTARCPSVVHRDHGVERHVEHRLPPRRRCSPLRPANRAICTPTLSAAAIQRVVGRVGGGR